MNSSKAAKPLFRSLSLSPDASIPASLELRQQYHARLMDLSFHGLEESVRHLLTRLGYEQVHMVGRTFTRGRTHNGGRDLEAIAQVGMTTARIVVQVKQYDRPVQRRFIDELRGVMARLGAKHGLLITTSHFPDIARAAANDHELLPVSLIDGSALIEMMLKYHLGVVKNKDRSWSIDEKYFGYLNTEYPSRSKPGQTARVKVWETDDQHTLLAAECNQSSGILFQLGRHPRAPCNFIAIKEVEPADGSAWKSTGTSVVPVKSTRHATHGRTSQSPSEGSWNVRRLPTYVS